MADTSQEPRFRVGDKDISEEIREILREKSDQISTNNAGLSPRLGIFWYMDGKLITAECPLSLGVMLQLYHSSLTVPSYTVPSVDHKNYWAELREQKTVPEVDYDYYPKGWVTYHGLSNTWVVFGDIALVDDENYKREIEEHFGLSESQVCFVSEEDFDKSKHAVFLHI